MSGKKRKSMRRRLEQSEPAVLPPDFFKAPEFELPSRGEIGDSSPPPPDETTRDDGHEAGCSKWEKELWEIVMNETKSIYTVYSLPEERGMISTARDVFETARAVVIQGFPNYFLLSKDYPAESTEGSDLNKGSVHDPTLILRNARVLVRKLFLPCHLTLLASKDYFNTEIRKLERDHAIMIASFVRDLRNGKVILKNGPVGNVASSYSRAEIPQSGKEKLIREVKTARDSVLHRRQKPTQVNVAREYGAPRKTMMDRLKKHGIDLKNL